MLLDCSTRSLQIIKVYSIKTNSSMKRNFDAILRQMNDLQQRFLRIGMHAVHNFANRKYCFPGSYKRILRPSLQKKLRSLNPL